MICATAVGAGLVLGVAGVALAAPPADKGNDKSPPGQSKDAASSGRGQGHNSPGAAQGTTGANQPGPFTSSGPSGPSLNGSGGGATGRPCAGCVGNADNKNPPGQSLNDNNNGYECDANNGIGRGNPAHSSCGSVVPPPLPIEPRDLPNAVPLVLAAQLSRPAPPAPAVTVGLPFTGTNPLPTLALGLWALSAGLLCLVAKRRSAQPSPTT